MASALLSSEGFAEAFAKATSMIILSEIGDKTFFIAALMAMKHPRTVVFLGAGGALALMTVLSAIFGWVAPNLIPKSLTHYAATGLFFVFGIRSLYQCFFGPGGGIDSEMEEVEALVQGKEKKDASGKSKADSSSLFGFLSPVFVETFSLTFLGEWGDRSQIATIVLAAEENVGGVALGGTLGHALCTGAAVLGGKHIASYISEQAVSFCSGALFIVFGLHNLLAGADGVTS